MKEVESDIEFDSETHNTEGGFWFVSDRELLVSDEFDTQQLLEPDSLINEAQSLGC